MRRRLPLKALVAALVAAIVAPIAVAAAERGLNVQARWRVVGVAATTSAFPALASSEVARALRHAGETVARELPGIRWEIASAVRAARFEDEPDGSRLELAGAGLEHLVERLAEKDDEVAGADVVFVYVAAPEQAYAGMSVLRARPRGKPPVWYAVVNTRQGPRMSRMALARLFDEAKKRGVELSDAERASGERLGRLLASPLDRGPGQRLALWASTVHEFGHLLAPGTKDVRAAKELSGWIENGADEPDKHDKRCVMWTPDPASLLAKLLAFPRVVQFCDGCRERLGLPRREPRPPLLEAAPSSDLK